jgi:hypothetical protein
MGAMTLAVGTVSHISTLMDVPMPMTAEGG